MQRVNDHIRDRLLAHVDDTDVGTKTETLSQLLDSERCAEFEKLRMNRKVVGRYRYGLMSRTEDTNYDRVGSIIKRLQEYQATGNMENLVDITNLCELEFAHSNHPNAHFDAADGGEHVERT